MSERCFASNFVEGHCQVHGEPLGLCLTGEASLRAEIERLTRLLAPAEPYDAFHAALEANKLAGAAAPDVLIIECIHCGKVLDAINRGPCSGCGNWYAKNVE